MELLIWGPSTKLLSESPDLQDKIKTMKKAGLILTSCLWCADQYKATKLLKQLGVDVKYMGKPLTEYLQSGKQVITF